MAKYLRELAPGNFFEVDVYSGEWYQLLDDMGTELDQCRFGVCVQTGIVKKFYLTDLVTRVYLKFTKHAKNGLAIIPYVETNR